MQVYLSGLGQCSSVVGADLSSPSPAQVNLGL